MRGLEPELTYKAPPRLGKGDCGVTAATFASLPRISMRSLSAGRVTFSEDIISSRWTKSTAVIAGGMTRRSHTGVPLQLAAAAC